MIRQNNQPNKGSNLTRNFVFQINLAVKKKEDVGEGETRQE